MNGDIHKEIIIITENKCVNSNVRKKENYAFAHFKEKNFAIITVHVELGKLGICILGIM